MSTFKNKNSEAMYNIMCQNFKTIGDRVGKSHLGSANIIVLIDNKKYYNNYTDIYTSFYEGSGTYSLGIHFPKELHVKNGGKLYETYSTSNKYGDIEFKYNLIEKELNIKKTNITVIVNDIKFKSR